MKSDMNSHKNPRSTLTEHLEASIQQVRDNLDAVSFWAHAVSGFAQPIPPYEPDEPIAGFQNVPFAGPAKRRGKAAKTRPGSDRARH